MAMEAPSEDLTRKRSPLVRRIAISLFLLIIALAIVVPLASRRREPICNGKTLGQWAMVRSEAVAVRPVHRQIDASAWAEMQSNATSRLASAELAIRHIGANGVPFLLDWLAYENPAPQLTWKQKGIALLLKIPMPKKFQAGLRYNSFNAYPERPPRPTPQDALWCFQLLGPNAAPAIPQLTRMALQRDHWQAACRAVDVLGGIGKDSLPALLDLATNYACPTRRQVVVALTQSVKGQAGPGNNVISRALLRCMKDGDIAVARQAARALGQLKVEPALAFPLLTDGLADPNLSFACIDALGEYGHEAQPVWPSLMALLNNDDPELHAAVSNAVVRINRNEAAR
jgi:hypothetical protein